MHVWFSCVWFSFSVLSQKIGWDEHLGSDLFCVMWDVKPSLSQSAVVNAYSWLQPVSESCEHVDAMQALMAGGLALKRKNVSSLVEKWQKVQQDVSDEISKEEILRKSKMVSHDWIADISPAWNVISPTGNSPTAMVSSPNEWHRLPQLRIQSYDHRCLWVDHLMSWFFVSSSWPVIDLTCRRLYLLPTDSALLTSLLTTLCCSRSIPPDFQWQ